MAHGLNPWVGPSTVSTPEFLTLERISVLVENGKEWDPHYARQLGVVARRYAEFSDEAFRRGVEFVLATYDNKHAIEGWLAEGHECGKRRSFQRLRRSFEPADGK